MTLEAMSRPFSDAMEWSSFVETYDARDRICGVRMRVLTCFVSVVADCPLSTETREYNRNCFVALMVRFEAAWESPWSMFRHVLLAPELCVVVCAFSV